MYNPLLTQKPVISNQDHVAMTELPPEGTPVLALLLHSGLGGLLQERVKARLRITIRSISS